MRQLIEFPTIRSLSDVMPYIEGRTDITVLKKEGYTVVKYGIQDSDTFDDTPDGHMRREFRGLIFDSVTGEILSRPFHKFFNVGEKPETMPENFSLGEPHQVLEKVDGSMVHPFLLNGKVEFATKSGITEVAEEARGVFDAFDHGGKRLDWISSLLEMGLSPIFEYVGPNNRIVIDYTVPSIVYLATRVNVTGQYIDPVTPYPGNRVRDHVSFGGSVSGYVDRVRNEVDREGDVVVFSDGFRVKIKTKWYVDLHAIKEDLNHEHRIAARAMSNTLDDVLGLVHDSDRDRVLNIGSEFLHDYHAKFDRIRSMHHNLALFVEEHPGDGTRKDVATKFVPGLPSGDAKYVFAWLDEKDILEMYDKEVATCLATGTRYAKLRKWMSE